MSATWNPGSGDGPLPPEGEATIFSSPYRRYEYKFCLPGEAEPDVRSLLEPYVRHDEHCASRPGRVYTVRSIYFDTDDLRFYHEKLDGVRVRRKLRIRAYNVLDGVSQVFLEIKRKRGPRGFKERVPLELGQLEPALDGQSPEQTLPAASFAARRALDRFRFNLKAVRLHPVVLVCYEREAFESRDGKPVRVTFDRGMRSLWNPRLDQLGEDRGLTGFCRDRWVLELKFDDRMPRWMGRLISALNLRRQPWSKYCRGLDACAPAAGQPGPPRSQVEEHDG